MQLELKHISQKLKVELAFSLEKVIIEVEQRIDDNTPVFMCVEGKTALLGYTHEFRMYEFFLHSTRNYFNSWCSLNYSTDILTRPDNSCWIKPVAPFNQSSLSRIRLRFLNHLLDNLNKAL